MVGGVIQGTVTAQSRAGSLGRGQWPTYTTASTLSAHPVCVSQAGKPRLGVPPYTAGALRPTRAAHQFMSMSWAVLRGPTPRVQDFGLPCSSLAMALAPLPRGLEDTQALSSALTTHPQSLGRQGGLLP